VWGIGIKALSVVIAVALLIVSAKIQVLFWPLLQWPFLFGSFAKSALAVMAVQGISKASK